MRINNENEFKASGIVSLWNSSIKTVSILAEHICFRHELYLKSHSFRNFMTKTRTNWTKCCLFESVCPELTKKKKIVLWILSSIVLFFSVDTRLRLFEKGIVPVQAFINTHFTRPVRINYSHFGEMFDIPVFFLYSER